MKKIVRNPLKFDVLNLCDALTQKQELNFNNIKNIEQLIDILRTSFQQSQTPIMIFGRRTEAMFGYVVASMERCKIIKKEDSGDLFTDTSADYLIPDYRIVTMDNDQFFVEIKNCHTKKGSNLSYSLDKHYIEKMISYCSVFNCELKLAIFWSSWNIWTLVSLDDFSRKGTSYSITLETSLMRNQMSILGDYMVGTTPPLSLKIIADENCPRQVHANGECSFNIKRVEMCCAGKVITNELEQKIAFFLMLNGGWEVENPIVIITDSLLEYFEIKCNPIDTQEDQMFSLLGSYSSLLSTHYKRLTAPNGEIERLSPDLEVENLGVRIPKEYKGVELPLWRFIMAIQ